MQFSGYGYDTLRYSGVLSLARRGEAPEGMVRIDIPAKDVRFGFGPERELRFHAEGRIGSFFVDTREVTNREYKRFVDDGGYSKREYLDGAVRAGRKDPDLGRGDGELPGRHRAARPGRLAGGHLRSGHGRIGRHRRELVRGGGLRRVGRASGCRRSTTSRWPRARFVGGDYPRGIEFQRQAGCRSASYRGSLNYWGLYDVGRQRQGVVLQHRGPRSDSRSAERPTNRVYMFWNDGQRQVSVRPQCDDRVPVHQVGRIQTRRTRAARPPSRNEVAPPTGRR